MNKILAGLFIIVCLLFLFSFPLKATSNPMLISPSDSEFTSELPTLNWQMVPEAIQYRVVIDDEPTVTGASIKNYYTVNTHYSPQLDPGTYYWKVIAKDAENIWSEWSSIWSFTYDTEEEGTPTPTITPTQTPVLTPSPTPTEMPCETQTPTPSPTLTPTLCPSVTPTQTPRPTPTPTVVPTPTESACPTFIPTPTPTASPRPNCQPSFPPFRFFWFRFHLPPQICPCKS
jgi:hypothetical protein